jgi:hypothetical protein
MRKEEKEGYIMSEHKFTAGPWETLDLGDALIVQPTDKRLHPICLVDRQRNVFANAALIASAPELYEALKKARLYVVGAYECAFPDQQENDEVLEEIDAAIKKAEGRHE